jgi:hypothetical protein
MKGLFGSEIASCKNLISFSIKKPIADSLIYFAIPTFEA